MDGQGQTPEPPRLIQPPPRRSLLARLRTYFLTGLVVTAPVGITAWLIWLFVDFVDTTVVPLIPEAYNPANFLPFSVPGIGVIIMLVAMTLIGAFVTNFLGRWLVGFGERIVARVPVVRTIYGVLKQIFDAVLAQRSGAFREVVLIEYPRHGIWVIGFVTGTTKGEISRLLDDEIVNIFLPTTPNPTSGFLLFMPRKDCVSLDMTVEEGIKLVISGGIVAPPDRLADPLDEAAEPVLPVAKEEAGATQPERK